MKILLVEDEPAVRDLILTCLEIWKHETIFAKDGIQAWKILKETPVQLMISDWMLPEMNGTELVIKIRQDRDLQTLPIMMISGKAEKLDIIKAIQKGVDGYLIKPFTPTQLRDEIQKIYKKRHDVFAMDEEINKILQGQSDLKAENDTGPLLILGEETNSAVALRRTENKKMLEYLIRVTKTVDKINQEMPELNFGYLMETDTTAIVELIKKRKTRDRIVMVLMSSMCKGNSVLMVRLICMNSPDKPVVRLIADVPELIPLKHRASLVQVNCDVLGRSQLDINSLYVLIRSAVMKGNEDVGLDDIRQRIIDDMEAIDILPILPQVYTRLSQLAKESESEIFEWIENIKLDPLSSAVLLRHARSAAYGLCGEITDIDRAVIMLGKEKVLEIVTSETMMRTLSTVQEDGFSVESLWRHSIVVGLFASMLTFPQDETSWSQTQKRTWESWNLPDNVVEVIRNVGLQESLDLPVGHHLVYMGGLIHDIGKAAMIQAYPGLYSMIQEHLRERKWKISMEMVEQEIAGGLTHTIAGEFLATKWGLGKELCNVIRNHHHPDKDDLFSFLISITDILGHAIYPFPDDAKFPIAQALKEGDDDILKVFLPENFNEQSFISTQQIRILHREMEPTMMSITQQVLNTMGVTSR